MPAAQSAAIRERERALASHADAIQAAVRQSGKVGGLAFLDAKDGHLVVLPGDSPADAWARYATSAESESSPVSMPAVVTFVYRTDVPKAPETVTQSALQQQRTSAAALATELRRVEEQIGPRAARARESMAATKQDTDKAVADMRALAEDLTAVRKFLLQTAQLGWLNHEMAVENANGIRKMAATSQELTASSARLEDTLRQLSETSRRPAQGAGSPARCHSGQNPEHQVRRQMHHGGPATRCLFTPDGGLLLALSAVADALAGEWEKIRENYDDALRTYEKRIEEIEAKERGDSGSAATRRQDHEG